MNHRLRPATPSDTAFLYRVHCATMREYIEKTWGWDEAWQRADFDERFARYAVSIIEVESAGAGCVWLEDRSDSLYVAELQILPEWQRRGIGTAVLRGVVARAASRGLGVELDVLTVNQEARRLYERLGFRATHGGAPLVHMRYAYDS